MDTSTNAKGVRVNRCGRVSVVYLHLSCCTTFDHHTDLPLINNLNLSTCKAIGYLVPWMYTLSNGIWEDSLC